MSALGRIAAAAFGFRCAKCAAPLDGASTDGTPPYCEGCCPEHDFRFDKYDGYRCAHCFAQPDDDWYDHAE